MKNKDKIQDTSNKILKYTNEEDVQIYFDRLSQAENNAQKEMLRQSGLEI